VHHRTARTRAHPGHAELPSPHLTNPSRLDRASGHRRISRASDL
jgi:hypothetical protein